MLIEDTLFGRVDKVAEAIKLLREHEPPKGYYVAFSGGKDSVVALDLVRRAGVKYDAHYNLTTVDPPELVYFIRDHYPEVWEARNRPKMTMWQLIVKKRVPPTRVSRYCCEVLKEGGGAGRVVVTGIRAEESSRRAKRQVWERGKRRKGWYLHPIIGWSTRDVWDYIRQRELPYCELYDEGFQRLGCVMCPFGGAKKMRQEMIRWPKIAEAYRRACIRAYDKAKADGLWQEERKKNWRSGDDMFRWWIGELQKVTVAESCDAVPLFSEDDGEGVL